MWGPPTFARQGKVVYLCMTMGDCQPLENQVGLHTFRGLSEVVYLWRNKWVVYFCRTMRGYMLLRKLVDIRFNFFPSASISDKRHWLRSIIHIQYFLNDYMNIFGFKQYLNVSCAKIF